MGNPFRGLPIFRISDVVHVGVFRYEVGLLLQKMSLNRFLKK